MTIIKEKWIDLNKTSFTESVEEGKDHEIEALIVPFDKISRNGVMYGKESIESRHSNLVNKPIFFNHQTSGATDDFLPRGEWYETSIEQDGMHAKGKIFKTSYNTGLIEYLSHAKNPKVSLQITGDAESIKTEEGKYYQKATIKEFLESSVVSLPGFINADAKFEAMCESLNNVEEFKEKSFAQLMNDPKFKDIIEQIEELSNDSKQGEIKKRLIKQLKKDFGYDYKENVEETEAVKDFKVGDKVGSDTGNGVIVKIVGNKVIVKLDSKDTETSFSVMDIWKHGKESFEEAQGGMLVFDSHRTAMSAKKILDRAMDADYTGEKQDALVVEDKAMAKVILKRKGMSGLDKQSFFDQLDVIRENINGFYSKLASVRVEAMTVSPNGKLKIGMMVKTPKGDKSKIVNIGKDFITLFIQGKPVKFDEDELTPQ